ncbi:MAG: ligase-associated DNA damage response exonuclease [Hyphomonas sp.]
MLRPDLLLQPTPKGLYCPPGDFYLDPVRGAVDRAVISHGHSDHARGGHGAVLSHPHTLAIMAARYGANFAKSTQALEYGEVIDINGVSVWLTPAGHILGSAQITVEYKGMRMTFTGDYKRRADPTCATFEPVADTHVFISEATFGLPVFRHPPTDHEIGKLLQSLADFPERTHCVGAYSLGKAQRIIRHLRLASHDAPIYIHGSLEKLCAVYEAAGVELGDLRPATIDDTSKAAREAYRGQVVIAPPGSFEGKWSHRFPDPLVGFASGWMSVRQRAKASGVELPLIISDHADWDELTDTVREVDPHELWVTYGREDALVRWAELEGRRARPLRLVGYDEEAG